MRRPPPKTGPGSRAPEGRRPRDAERSERGARPDRSGSDRAPERSGDRGPRPERGARPDRGGSERGPDRGPDRSGDRSPARSGDRGPDRAGSARPDRGDRGAPARPEGGADGGGARGPRPAQKRAPSDLPPVRGDRLEGRNVVVEALERGRRAVRTIWLDVGARPDEKVSRILALAGDRVVRVERTLLDRMSLTGVHNGVIAEADPLPEPTVRELLEEPEPFLVLVDEIQYEHNLGAVLRSALGAGVNGVVIPTQRGKGLTPVVQRVSMGGAEAVPVVRAGISSALADIRRAGVRVIGADMDGAPPWELDLTGPIAFVLGGEDKGLTDPVRKRCDAIAGIPLAGGLQSLNVSVTAGILLFERVRQVAAKKG